MATILNARMMPKALRMTRCQISRCQNDAENVAIRCWITRCQISRCYSQHYSSIQISSIQSCAASSASFQHLVMRNILSIIPASSHAQHPQHHSSIQNYSHYTYLLGSALHQEVPSRVKVDISDKFGPIPKCLYLTKFYSSSAQYL